MSNEKKKIIGAMLYEIDEAGRFIDRRHIKKHPELVLPPDTFLLSFKNGLDNKVLQMFAALSVVDSDLQQLMEKRVRETCPAVSNATKKSAAQQRQVKKVRFRSGKYYQRREIKLFRKLALKALNAW